MFRGDVRYVIGRRRSFTAFKDEAAAARFIVKNQKRIISVRRAHGRVIVNHYIGREQRSG